MDSSPSETTLRTLFIATAASHPEDNGVQWITPDGSAFALAHSERLARARVVAEVAAGLDIRAGSRVGLFLPAVPAWLDLFLGFASTGTAVVALPPTLPANDAIQILRETDADALFVGDGQTDEACAIGAALPRLRIVSHADVPYPSAPHESAATAESFLDYRTLFSSSLRKAFDNGAAFDRSEPSRDDVALVANDKAATHGDLLDIGEKLLAEFCTPPRPGKGLDDIHIAPDAAQDPLSMIGRAISLPLLASSEDTLPPCVVFDGLCDA